VKKKENPIGQVIKGSLLHSQEPRGLLSSDDLSKFEIISTTWWIVIHRLDDVGKATYLFFPGSSQKLNDYARPMKAKAINAPKAPTIQAQGQVFRQQ